MLSKFLERLIGLVGLITLVGYSYQILSTWIYHALSIGWFAEVAVYALTWAMFLSWSEIVKSDEHIRADYIVSKVGPKTLRWFEFINCTVGVIFSLLMFWYGWRLTYDAWSWDDRSPSGLAFPLWIYYSAAPIGGLLLTYRYAERLVAALYGIPSSSQISE